MGNTKGASVYLDSGKVQSVLSKLSRIADGAEGNETKALLAGSLTVVNAAKRRVPKKTGTLSRSIHSEVDADGSVLVGTDVEYAKYVEQGTHKMAGRPYLQPALLENKDNVTKKVQVAMQQLISSQGGA